MRFVVLHLPCRSGQKIAIDTCRSLEANHHGAIATMASSWYKNDPDTHVVDLRWVPPLPDEVTDRVVSAVANRTRDIEGQNAHDMGARFMKTINASLLEGGQLVIMGRLIYEVVGWTDDGATVSHIGKLEPDDTVHMINRPTYLIDIKGEVEILCAYHRPR